MQNTINKNQNRGLMVNSVLFLVAFVFLANLETERNAATGFHFYPAIITSELVVQPFLPVFPQPDNTALPINAAFSAKPDFSLLHKILLLDYAHMVSLHIKTNEIQSNFQNQITQILPKRQTRYNAADEDGNFISLS